MARSIDELLEAFHSAASLSSSVSRLDLLMDLVATGDPRVPSILLHVMTDSNEPRAARIAALKQMRNGHGTSAARPRIAAAIAALLSDAADPQVSLQAALALRDFTDVEGVVVALGRIALGVDYSPELRYAAFTALERAEQNPGYPTLLRQLADDTLLGRVASSALRLWATRRTPTPNP